ncbi:hypothetical protein [Clostridium saccharoperbutylacetonicum]
MKCKIKNCYNEAEGNHKYCKYHVMVNNNKNGKVILKAAPVVALLLGIGIKKILKKKNKK